MTARRCVPRPAGSRSIRSERIKDEIYRQMFRLEEGRPGAEMGLAVVLLHTWIAADSEPQCREDRDWLKMISPICLQMIEAALRANVTALPSAQ